MILDADFSEKLKAVLSDPEALSKISAIAGSLNPPMQKSDDSVAEKELPEPQNALQTQGFGGFDLIGSGDPRLALLSSVKPLLREEKRDRVDALIKAMTVASMMKNFRK